jgi:hypothetical protein
MRELLQSALQHIHLDKRRAFEESVRTYLMALDATLAEYTPQLVASSAHERLALERQLLTRLYEQIYHWQKSVMQASNSGWQAIKADWHMLSAQVEHKERQCILATTDDDVELKQQLWWMEEMERCSYSDLQLVRQTLRSSRFQSEGTIDLLIRTEEKLTQRIYAPELVIEREEQAYQLHRTEWDRQYQGQYVAIHCGQVTAAHDDRTQLIELLRRQQVEHGPMCTYIVQIGAPLLACSEPAGE